MRTLHLCRHGKAVPEGPEGDRSRPLDERGRRDLRAMAAWLAKVAPQPDLVLCSEAARTRQTLELLLPAFTRRPRVLYEDGLYLASAVQLLARLRQIPLETGAVMLVGHNPGLHELAILLADKSHGPLPARLAEGLPTAAVASYEVPVDWAALGRHRARIVACVTPKELARGAGGRP